MYYMFMRFQWTVSIRCALVTVSASVAVVIANEDGKELYVNIRTLYVKVIVVVMEHMMMSQKNVLANLGTTVLTAVWVSKKHTF